MNHKFYKKGFSKASSTKLANISVLKIIVDRKYVSSAKVKGKKGVEDQENCQKQFFLWQKSR